MMAFEWFFFSLVFYFFRSVFSSALRFRREKKKKKNTRTQIIFDWNLDKILFCDFCLNEKEKKLHTLTFHFISGLWLFWFSLCVIHYSHSRICRIDSTLIAFKRRTHRHTHVKCIVYEAGVIEQLRWIEIN